MKTRDTMGVAEMSEEAPGRVDRPFDETPQISSLDDLPPPDTRRWVVRRKAAVIQAVRAGLLTLDEACARYHLSAEEFLSWQRLIDSHGLRGLRATRLQDYRAERPADQG
jgi:hypothetical protein